MDFHERDSLYMIFLEIIKLHYHRTHLLLDKVGVYPGQPPMLYALHRKNGQSQRELAEKLKIKPATITVMLSRMEKAGLVERKQDPDDQRISRVYLTDQGKEVWTEVSEVVKIINNDCFNNFTSEEQILLRRLLMQVRDNLNKVCDEK
ncbi:MarR family transcriptional regulator [Clostridium sp. CX1]|uniref:MarR family winged helix-turn-helix transcriptional regulator n=1 Tax=Clostridium sp. CX1 TaxID=2978346 RepID=UPI0021BE8BC9|nr:MarR family transcriptional regulator [Clostridium sp. CX1]MCT8975207.1 MarR family transcriptional regulator [Clostridium sp. CX1]